MKHIEPTKNILKALYDMNSTKKSHVYVAYVAYAIGTWLCKWGTFNIDEVDIEFDQKVFPLAQEYLMNYDDPDRPFMDCLNEFMNMKKKEVA